MTDRVQFARTTLVYHSPPFLQPGDAEMDLVADVLADGVSSRLYRRLVAERQLASAVSARQESMMLGSLFRIEATARPGVALDEVEREIDLVVGELLRRGPTRRELRQKQARLEYRILARLQSLPTKAEQLNQYLFYRGEPDSFRWNLERYRSATPASVRRAAVRVLDPDQRLVLRVLPAQPAPAVNARDRQPEVGAAAPFTPPLPTTFTLSNGVTVHHWERRELPLVKVLLQLPFGAASDPDEQAGLADLTASMIDEGTATLDAAGLAQELELLGASIHAECDQESTEIELSTLRRTAAPALALLREAVLRPRLDPVEWARVQRVHVERLRRAHDHAEYVAQAVATRRFFGDAHPYRHLPEGTPEGAAAVTLDAVRRFHAAVYRPEHATLLVAGDLDVDEARRLLEESFGAWRADAATPALVPPRFNGPAPRQLEVALVDRPDAVQTVITLMVPAPRYADPRRPRLELINTILGGSFTSRLNQNLREQHGYTYGAFSGYAMEPSVGSFSAGASVHTEVTGAALRELLYELGRLKRSSITADELGKARALRRMEVVQSCSGLGGILWTAAIAARNGRPFSALGDELRALEAVEPAALNRLAADAVPLERGVLVLVGDRRKIRPQLAGLQLPQPVLLDSSGAPMPTHPPR